MDLETTIYFSGFVITLLITLRWTGGRYAAYKAQYSSCDWNLDRNFWIFGNLLLAVGLATVWMFSPLFVVGLKMFQSGMGKQVSHRKSMQENKELRSENETLKSDKTSLQEELVRLNDLLLQTWTPPGEQLDADNPISIKLSKD